MDAATTASVASVILDDDNKVKSYVTDNDLPKIYEGIVMGSTGTSVGTHLALESIFTKAIEIKFDDTREIPTADIDKYKFHIWNIYTIVRNLLQAIPYKNKHDILMDKFFPKLLSREVNNIATMYMFDTDCKPLLFFPDYTKIYRGMNMNKKEGYTKVYEEHMMVKDVLTKFKNSGMLKSVNDGKGYKLPKLEGKVLLTTNLSVDLCNSGDIEILDSHTGTVKKKYQFNSKYHPIGTDKLEYIPFIEKLLYVLGDRTIIKPMNIVIRRDLTDLAGRCKWTARTSYDKVSYDILNKASPTLQATFSGYRNFY